MGHWHISQMDGKKQTMMGLYLTSTSSLFCPEICQSGPLLIEDLMIGVTTNPSIWWWGRPNLKVGQLWMANFCFVRRILEFHILLESSRNAELSGPHILMIRGWERKWMCGSINCNTPILNTEVTAKLPEFGALLPENSENFQNHSPQWAQNF